MIKTVIFDLDDTLYDYKDSHRIAMYAICAYCEREFGLTTRETTEGIDKIMKQQFDEMGPIAASHNRIIRFQRFLEERDLPVFPHALTMSNLYWKTLMDTAIREPGIRECLAMLRDSDIRLGVGTNMTALIQYQKLDQLKLGEYFDFIVTSEEIGIDKPDPAFFQCCIEKAQAEPDEILFIGDNYEFDIKGARSAGMHALLYDPKDLRPNEAHRINDYRDLTADDIQAMA